MARGLPDSLLFHQFAIVDWMLFVYLLVVTVFSLTIAVKLLRELGLSGRGNDGLPAATIMGLQSNERSVVLRFLASIRRSKLEEIVFTENSLSELQEQANSSAILARADAIYRYKTNGLRATAECLRTMLTLTPLVYAAWAALQTRVALGGLAAEKETPVWLIANTGKEIVGPLVPVTLLVILLFLLWRYFARRFSRRQARWDLIVHSLASN